MLFHAIIISLVLYIDAVSSFGSKNKWINFKFIHNEILKFDVKILSVVICPLILTVYHPYPAYSIEGTDAVVTTTMNTDIDDGSDENYNTEIENLKIVKRPKPSNNIFDTLQKKTTLEKLYNMPSVGIGDDDLSLANSEERILTLKAYLDEAERDLFRQNWSKLVAYLNIFTDQENAFVNLINGLFPVSFDDDGTGLNKVSRDELTLEAQTMFLAIDDLREAAKNHQFGLARSTYSKLLLAYDRFLKAGHLYPSYDLITSTEVFFAKTPRNTLRFDETSQLDVLDKVILTIGPDLGKTGTIIDIDESKNRAVVKFDKNEYFYQEAKEIDLSMLAKPLL